MWLFRCLTQFIASGPVVAIELVAENALCRWRLLLGNSICYSVSHFNHAKCFTFIISCASRMTLKQVALHSFGQLGHFELKTDSLFFLLGKWMSPTTHFNVEQVLQVVKLPGWKHPVPSVHSLAQTALWMPAMVQTLMKVPAWYSSLMPVNRDASESLYMPSDSTCYQPTIINSSCVLSLSVAKGSESSFITLMTPFYVQENFNNLAAHC